MGDLLSLREVEMFDKAKEIQSLMEKPTDIDFNHFRTGWDKYGRTWFRCSEQHFVWIPDQGELQAIAYNESPRQFERIDFLSRDIKDAYDIRHLLNRFNDFIDKLVLNQGIHQQPCLYQFGSIRQLWLAFVMYSKYGKVWKDGNWIGSIYELGA